MINENSANEHIKTYVEEGINKTDWDLKISTAYPENILLTSAMKGTFGIYAQSVQELIFKGIAIHNDYLVGLSFKTAMIDALHTPEIINFKDESYELALNIANWRANRHQVRSSAESLKQLFTSIIQEFHYNFFAKHDGLRFIFDGFLFCLAREYFSLTAYKDISPYTGEMKFNYPVSRNTLHLLNFYNNTFGLMSYAVRELTRKAFPQELLLTDFLSGTRKFDLLFDIAEMMPYFLKNWDASKHKLYESDPVRAYLDLSLSIPEIKIAFPSTTDSFIRHLGLGLCWYPATGKCAWIYGEWLQDDLKDHLEALFLPKIHEHLLDLFSKVNMKVKRRINAAAANEEKEDLPFIEHAIHSHLLKELDNQNNELNEPEEVSSENDVRSSNLVIPQLRYSRFKNFMADQFNCTFESGKGSEIKVQRQGSKIYTLGHHKKDPLMPTWIIKNILRRLEIENSEFALKLDAL